mmetsp:Transcript_72149/g.228023  ORF Transcript_72149/g.228023 Transcript_72149/m.228023 type:complete len:216 (-) Transcript_72149:436-1083(-)
MSRVQTTHARTLAHAALPLGGSRHGGDQRRAGGRPLVLTAPGSRGSIGAKGAPPNPAALPWAAGSRGRPPAHLLESTISRRLRARSAEFTRGVCTKCRVRPSGRQTAAGGSAAAAGDGVATAGGNRTAAGGRPTAGRCTCAAGARGTGAPGCRPCWPRRGSVRRDSDAGHRREPSVLQTLLDRGSPGRVHLHRAVQHTHGLVGQGWSAPPRHHRT